MKKYAVILIAVLAMILTAGCGQEMQVTVYNCGVNVSAADEWLHVIINWEDGGSASFYPSSRALGESQISALNSYTFNVRENKEVTVEGGG